MVLTFQITTKESCRNNKYLRYLQNDNKNSELSEDEDEYDVPNRLLTGESDNNYKKDKVLIKMRIW